MTAAEARRPARDIVTDKPGRGFRSAGSAARHAFEPPHDVQKMQKHAFVRRLADVLDSDRADGAFERLVLVAPPRTLGELRSLLSPRVSEAVACEVAKDLTTVPPVERQRALAETLGSLPL